MTEYRPGYRTMDASDGNYMVINGMRYPVINSWVETDADDGRKRWGIVTEEPVTMMCPNCTTPEDYAKAIASLKTPPAPPGPCRICQEPPHLPTDHRYVEPKETEVQPVTPAVATVHEGPASGSLYDGKCEEWHHGGQL